MGLRCEGDVDECLDRPCHPSGTAACHSLANAFYCQCLPGHTGKAWHLWGIYKTRTILTVPSQKAASLLTLCLHTSPLKSPLHLLAHISCTEPTVRRQPLKPGLTSNLTPTTGQRCEVEMDLCQSQPCSNGGSCEITTGPTPGFTCHCPKVSDATPLSLFSLY